MGDRRMLEIKTENGSLYVYAHSHGFELPGLAVQAAKAAAVRLGDECYWTRIFLDQLLKPGRDSECGWGVMLLPNYEDGYRPGGVEGASVLVESETGEVTELWPVVTDGKGPATWPEGRVRILARNDEPDEDGVHRRRAFYLSSEELREILQRERSVDAGGGTRVYADGQGGYAFSLVPV